jgi:hypothetical protein
MMHVDPEDEALEARLRAYRPASPPERLREAVLGLAARRGSRRLPGWLTLAALLLLAITLRWSARSDAALGSERASVALLPSPLVLGASRDPRTAAVLLQFAERWRPPEPMRAPIDPSVFRGER